MYRLLVILPESADPVEVDALIEGIASSFRARPEIEPDLMPLHWKPPDRAFTRSVGPLGGSGAEAGGMGWILEADFPTHFDAIKALFVPHLQTAFEKLKSTTFLFEVREV